MRPPLPREVAGGKQFQLSVSVDDSCTSCTISENLAAWKGGSGPVGSDGIVYNTHNLKFDYVYDQDASQATVYDRSAKDAVISTLMGYNAAMIAYGQTGTGKTYTMEGDRTSMAAYGRAAATQSSGPDGSPGPNPVDLSMFPERGIIPRAIEDIFGYIQSDSSVRSKYLVRASYVQIYNEVGYAAKVQASPDRRLKASTTRLSKFDCEKG